MPWATEHAAARTSRLGACSVAFSATVAGAKKLNVRVRLQEVKQNCVATEAEKVLLFGQLPPIVKMDNTLGTLKACKLLALSSNCIEKITGLKGLDMLEVLSIGRNCIKKLEGLDEVAGTLQQLWCSYNLIDKLNGIEKLTNLTVLYMRCGGIRVLCLACFASSCFTSTATADFEPRCVSNNLVSKWTEFEKFKELAKLEELLFVGNPIHEASAGTVWNPSAHPCCAMHPLHCELRLLPSMLAPQTCHVFWRPNL